MDVKERLPILAALKKAVSAAYDAAKDELESSMDMGDRKTLFTNGEKTGSASMTEGRQKVQIIDPKRLKDWCDENDILYTISLPSSYWGKGGFMQIEGESLVTKNGEIVPGVYVEQGEPYLSIRDCAPEKVLPLISQEQFIAALADVPLLEGGNDD